MIEIHRMTQNILRGDLSSMIICKFSKTNNIPLTKLYEKCIWKLHEIICLALLIIFSTSFLVGEKKGTFRIT